MKLVLGTVLCLAFCAAPISSANSEKLKEVFHWKTVDYAWEKPEHREAALASGEYVPSSNLPLGLASWKDKLFVTVPRWKGGVISSLNYVKVGDKSGLLNSSPSSPALIPYPSFAANHINVNGTNEGKPIVSVFRVTVDHCDRLWVMDTGVTDLLGEAKAITRPKILVYNLNTDELIRSYEFKDEDKEENSFFGNIIVDSDAKSCDKAYAYVPDIEAYGIVSYSFETNSARRIKHNFFHFDPLAGDLKVGGVEFQWKDGIFSIALTKPMEDGSRTAYFHCLASTKEFSVNTKVFKNKDQSKTSYYDYKVVGDRGADSQSSASFIDEETGVMFYSQLQKDSLNCWNTNKPLVQENLAELASNNETMIFTNDIKVDHDGYLWVLSDKLPVFIYRGLDDNEINYRIFGAKVKDIIADTKCAA